MILRVYNPPECDPEGKPVDLERCRTCAGLGGIPDPDGDVVVARATKPEHYSPSQGAEFRVRTCSTCDGHGSLRAAALAALGAGGPLARNANHPLVNYEGAVGGLRTRCEGCGHPMSDGTWADDHHGAVIANLRPADLQNFADSALGCLRDGNEPHMIEGVVHYSSCDSGCRHCGPGRVNMGGPAGWEDATPVFDRGSAGEFLRWCHVRLEASWRPVDVRMLGRAHDLRPEKLACLCLRCWADRITTRGET